MTVVTSDAINAACIGAALIRFGFAFVDVIADHAISGESDIANTFKGSGYVGTGGIGVARTYQVTFVDIMTANTVVATVVSILAEASVTAGSVDTFGSDIAAVGPETFVDIRTRISRLIISILTVNRSSHWY